MLKNEILEEATDEAYVMIDEPGWFGANHERVREQGKRVTWMRDTIRRQRRLIEKLGRTISEMENEKET